MRFFLASLTTAFIFLGIPVAHAQAPSISEAEGLFCVPLAISPTRDAISFVRRYKTNADREGIKNPEIGKIIHGNYYLVTTKKSNQATLELAAEQVSMGLIDQVYRLEEKYVGSKTLYVFNPNITALIYGDGKKHYLHKNYKVCLGTLDDGASRVELSDQVEKKTEIYLKAKMPQYSFERAPKKEREDPLAQALPPGILNR